MISARVAITTCLFIYSGFAQTVQPTKRASDSVLIRGKECLDAARKALGEHAEVLKCGTLNDPNVLESVAVIRKSSPRHAGTFVSQLAIMRRQGSGWTRSISVSREIENQAGFVGIDYIDDSSLFWAYSVQFHDHRADGKKAFVISLAYMADERDNEELPVDISWNEATGRYQEFTMNEDPAGFKSELRNPPRR